MNKGDLVLQCLVDHTVLLESGLAFEHGRHDLQLKVLSAATYTKTKWYQEFIQSEYLASGSNPRILLGPAQRVNIVESSILTAVVYAIPEMSFASYEVEVEI